MDTDFRIRVALTLQTCDEDRELLEKLRTERTALLAALYKITKVEAGTVMTSLSMRTIARAALEAYGDKSEK